MESDEPVTRHGKIWRWEVITGLCLINGLRIGAELGVSHGRFCTYLLSVMHDAQIVGVDLWASQPPRDEECAETYDDPVQWQHEAKLERLRKWATENYKNRLVLVRDHTVNAAKLIHDEALDFVFIDADHSESGVRNDIAAWAPKVRRGGLIAGHDYDWPPVKRVVDEIYPGRSLAADNVWFIFK